RWTDLQNDLRVPDVPAPDRPVRPEGPADAAPERTIDEFVDAALADRLAADAVLPANADNLAGLLRECLERCRNGPPDCRVEAVDFPFNPPRPVTYHGKVRIQSGGQVIQVGLTATTESSPNAATAVLRRLAADAAPP